MEDMTELQAKLHRVQAEIEEGIGRLTKQRAFIANRLAEGEDVSQFVDVLASLEDTQLLHVQQRDRLRRNRDGSRPPIRGAIDLATARPIRTLART